MNAKLLVPVLVLVLLVLAAAPVAAAPFHSTSLPDYVSGPCAPGAIYESACDVDHDGDVDVFDIQLTAGRWGQTGTWLSDNDHNHLGQTWTGSNNPLKINGSFGTSRTTLHWC